MLIGASSIDGTQLALALINAVQIILLAVINQRTRATSEKLNGHLDEHVHAAVQFERARANDEGVTHDEP